ncbi:hypothetical protein [Rhizobium sp. BK176]|uniref:hypothetical protein n=1 Tax=Rhizobium sp. BK176 TaxID=2587071 RepID=UPI002168170E|nr:hypothetical protein [Rhizobium sp. BK176]MCS4088790.1 hypothetical protein [Rhizobium sp. BK176]
MIEYRLFDARRSRGKTVQTAGAATKIVGHPLLEDTLKAIAGKTDIVDNVAAALSARADELAALAEAKRFTPEWSDLCIAMGAARSAAAEVWRH